MKNSSIFRMLLLLNFLLKGRFSRKEIVEEYEKHLIYIGETSVSNYIKKLRDNGIGITEEKDAKAIYYSVNFETPFLQLSEENLKILEEAKKLLYVQKNYKYVKYAMELFYKVSKYIEDEDVKDEFLDFGYYSELNWGLIDALEKHCETKDIILLEYLMPQGDVKTIQFHVDKIVTSDTSERLYLYGMMENGQDFFQLPIDRILMIKKVLYKSVRFNFDASFIKYKISISAFRETKLEDNEVVIEKDNEFVTIQTPVINEFHLVQRLLHFCPELYYISEGKIKNLVKEKLQIIKALYGKRAIDK